jgi:hypothetical protein
MVMVKYFHNGNPVTTERAWEIITHESVDIDPEELAVLWLHSQFSEEARDTIFDLSDCTLEIVVDE